MGVIGGVGSSGAGLGLVLGVAGGAFEVVMLCVLRGARGAGPLMSRAGGWALCRRLGSRGGEASTEAVDEDDATTDGRDLGEGTACDERWRAGEDMEPPRSDP
jgi:hypothetical protein